MKKLPIGIQTFQNLIEEGYYYVDKTPYVRQLTEEGKYYFLSRPRRFGKSLFLSTLKSAFLDQKELFHGLYLEKSWAWGNSHPVVHISFGAGVMQNLEDLHIRFASILDRHAEQYGIEFKQTDLRERFSELIVKLADKYRLKTVVLVDEYDKPVLDNIERTETALEIREALKNIYSVIKDSDQSIRFVFITGVSKFSKVSLFSGLNNLEDISLDKRYSAICGYTQEDLETIFSDRLGGVNLSEVKSWYNGYNWLGQEVYNPFDILLYLKNKEFRNYWFETATPTFLIKILEGRKYFIPDIEKIQAGEEIIASFEIDDLKVETLLFQTGYLTIRNFSQVGAFRKYTLRYPNLEVKASLTNYILSFLVNDKIAKTKNQSNVIDALLDNDLDKLHSIFGSFFASIPHDWYRKNELAGYEGYYSSIFYCYFTALGLDVTAEDSTNYGCIDMTVKTEDYVYIFEFKVVELSSNTERPLKQIKSRKYFEKYLTATQDVYIVGVTFSKKERNIVGYEWEQVK